MTIPNCTALAGLEATAVEANPNTQVSAASAGLTLNMPFAAFWSDATMQTEPELPPEPAADEPQETAAVLAGLLFAAPMRIWHFAVEGSPDTSGRASDSAVPQAEAAVETFEAQAQNPAGDIETLSLDISDTVPASDTETESLPPQMALNRASLSNADRAPAPHLLLQAEERHRQPEKQAIHVRSDSTGAGVSASPVRLVQEAGPRPQSADVAAVSRPPAIPELNDSPVLHSGQARQISLDVRGDDGGIVQVRFAADDPGNVRIEIRAANEPLSKELRLHSADLMARLEDRGFEVRSAERSGSGDTADDRSHQHGGQRREQDDKEPASPQQNNKQFQSVFQMQGR